MKDDLGALSVVLNQSTESPGRLSGATFVVKENIDVAGQVSTNGHPQWAASHAPARRRTRRSSIGCSPRARVSSARRIWTRWPIACSAPIRITARRSIRPRRTGIRAVRRRAPRSPSPPASSISRSARTPPAPAARRRPFAACIGFRSSHGAISMDGVVPLAPSLDAIGWFARDTST